MYDVPNGYWTDMFKCVLHEDNYNRKLGFTEQGSTSILHRQMPLHEVYVCHNHKIISDNKMLFII